jgi:hypothetical protein
MTDPFAGSRRHPGLYDTPSSDPVSPAPRGRIPNRRRDHGKLDPDTGLWVDDRGITVAVNPIQRDGDGWSRRHTFAPATAAEYDAAKRAACEGRVFVPGLISTCLANAPVNCIKILCKPRQRAKRHRRILGASRPVLFTPATAAELLATSPASGRPEESKVHAFAAAMRDGAWRDGDPIVVRGGRLEDGRHRLAAVVLLGRPQELSVKFVAPTRGDRRLRELIDSDDIAGFVVYPGWDRWAN